MVLLRQRLDYAAIEEEYAVAIEDRAEARREAKAKAKKRPAPPQKPFDFAWFSASGAASEVQRSRWPKAAALEGWRDARKEFFVFEGQHYLNGFLYKEVGIDATLDVGSSVMPSIEQVQRFVKGSTGTGGRDAAADDDDEDEDEEARLQRDGDGDKDLTLTELVAKATELAQAAAKGLGGAGGGKPVPFSRGDKVASLALPLGVPPPWLVLGSRYRFASFLVLCLCVCCQARVVSGDNAGLVGRVVSLDSIQRTVKLLVLDLPGQHVLAGKELDYNAADLVKHLVAGAHVRVVDGVLSGETGTVVKVDAVNNVAFVFTDLAPREIEVRLSDLEESSEVAQGLNELGGFTLYDLVNKQKP
jgi:ribosomal protein L24